MSFTCYLLKVPDHPGGASPPYVRRKSAEGGEVLYWMERRNAERFRDEHQLPVEVVSRSLGELEVEAANWHETTGPAHLTKMD